MTLASELARIASEISLCAPDQATRLHALAAKVRRVELVLDEIVDDAMESARLAEVGALSGNVIRLRKS